MPHLKPYGLFVINKAIRAINVNIILILILYYLVNLIGSESMVPNVILIYANCKNTTAKGDFAFAGNIAKDLKEEIDIAGKNIDIILTSTLDGMERFEKLYGKPIDGKTSIEGINIGICALELLDPLKNKVIAFIEANRCKYAPASIIKRVISPDSKFLFIGAANQAAISSPFVDYFRYLDLQGEQSDLYNHFDADDIKLRSSGLGP